MDLTRRAFISLVGLQAVALSSKASAFEDGEIDYRLPILQGATDESSTQFSIIHPKSSKYRFVLLDAKKRPLRDLMPTTTEKHNFSRYAVSKFKLEGLSYPHEYFLQVYHGKQLVDERQFGLLDANKPSLKFALVSCMNDHLYSERIWTRLDEQKPDVVFMIGDSVYCDHRVLFIRKAADLEQLWDRYCSARHKLRYYKEYRLTPTIAVWDDHDYGFNNADRNFRYKNESTYVFNTMFAQEENANLIQGPGVSSCVELANQRFLLLDGRSFRAAPGEKDPAYFGNALELWVYDILSKKDKPTWLMSGTQWFGAYRKKEGFEYAQPELFNHFLSTLRNIGSKIVFVSGDIHLSEVMHIEKKHLGYSTFEVTSSAMHSFTGFGFNDSMKNPRRIKSYGGKNFNVIQSSVNAGELIADVNCVKANGKPGFTHKIAI